MWNKEKQKPPRPLVDLGHSGFFLFFFFFSRFCCYWQQTAAVPQCPTDWTSRPAIIGKSCCQGPTPTAARGAYFRHLFSLPGTSPTIRAAAQSAAIFTPRNPPTARPPVWNTYCQIQLGCGEKRKNRCECFTPFSPMSAWERTCFDLRSLSFPHLDVINFLSLA